MEPILEQIEQLFKDKKYQEIITLLSDTILTDHNNATLYSWRARAHGRIGDTESSFIYAQKSIDIDPLSANGYFARGNAWVNKSEYDKAIIDYTEAIRLDPKSANAYSNRGSAWSEKGENDKAIIDYNEAIRLDPESAYTYKNRGNIWYDRKDYGKAIEDYERYAYLTNDLNDYNRQVTLSRIEELNKRIRDAWYDEIDSIVDEIKQILLFDNPCLTHYTSLSGARAMILDNSAFRLSEGSFLNDTSEGRELFNYLSSEIIKRTTDETIAEVFVEKPFIGSFVEENKHNDLTLWRMYGKEAQAEAKGCALTILKESFIDDLKKKLSLTDIKVGIQSQSEEQFTFYNVAYLSKDKFVIPGKSKVDDRRLNGLMATLRNKINELTEKQKNSINKLLNDIAYLFKSSEYQYEREVRLVVQGVGFAKKIEQNPPKVYIEMVDIVPALSNTNSELV